MLRLPYAHLNLTRNPFGELSAQERGRLAIADIERFIDPLKTVGFVLQIMGEQGRGKSTHLHALRQHFPTAPYLYYPEDGPKPKVPKAKLLFLDETQRFTKKERLRILKQKASFVIATHQDHREEFKQLKLEHVSITLNSLSVTTLASILEKRLEASRRAAGPLPYFEQDALEQLIKRFDDDLRSIFEYLYDIFQSLEEIESVKLQLTKQN